MTRRIAFARVSVSYFIGMVTTFPTEEVHTKPGMVHLYPARRNTDPWARRRPCLVPGHSPLAPVYPATGGGRWAAMASKACRVAVSMAGSCGTGQLDNFTPTNRATRLTYTIWP